MEENDRASADQDAQAGKQKAASLEQRREQRDAGLAEARTELYALGSTREQAQMEPPSAEAEAEEELVDQPPVPRQSVGRIWRWPLVVCAACAPLFLALAAYLDMANRKMATQLNEIPVAITKITKAHPDSLAEVRVAVQHKGANAALTALVDRMRTVKTEWENADETRKQMVGKIKRLEDDKKKHEAVLRYIGGDKKAKDVPSDEWLLIWRDKDGGLEVKDSGNVPAPKKAALDKLRGTVLWADAIQADTGPDDCAVLWIDGQKTMRQKLGRNVKKGHELARRVEWAAAMSGAAGPDAVWQQLTTALQKAGGQAVQRLVSEARYKKGQPWDLGKALGVYQDEIAQHAKKQPGSSTDDRGALREGDRAAAGSPYLMDPEKVYALWEAAVGKEDPAGKHWQQKRAYFWLRLAMHIQSLYFAEGHRVLDQGMGELWQWTRKVDATLEKRMESKNDVDKLFFQPRGDKGVAHRTRKDLLRQIEVLGEDRKKLAALQQLLAGDKGALNGFKEEPWAAQARDIAASAKAWQEIQQRYGSVPKTGYLLIWLDEKGSLRVHEPTAKSPALALKAQWVRAMSGQKGPQDVWALLEGGVGTEAANALRQKACYREADGSWDLLGALKFHTEKITQKARNDASKAQEDRLKQLGRELPPPDAVYLLDHRKVRALWSAATKGERVLGEDWEAKRVYFWHKLALRMNSYYWREAHERVVAGGSKELKQWSKAVGEGLDRCLKCKADIDKLFLQPGQGG